MFISGKSAELQLIFNIGRDDRIDGIEHAIWLILFLRPGMLDRSSPSARVPMECQNALAMRMSAPSESVTSSAS